MRILEGLINFIKDLIAREISFLKSIWVLIRRNWSLESLICQIKGLTKKTLKCDSQSGVWLRKFKTKDQIIKDVRLQGLKLTKSGGKLKKIKFLKNDVKLDDWVWQGSNCMKIRIWKAIRGAIKSNWKNSD